jgi:hypothetical protein
MSNNWTVWNLSNVLILNEKLNAKNICAKKREYNFTGEKNLEAVAFRKDCGRT